MRTANGPSWQVRVDVPEVLQFAAYIGEREGFASPGSRPPCQPAEAEWTDWWNSLVTQAVESAGPAIDPPEFHSLAARPHLRDLCGRYWGDFADDWRETKMPLARRVQDQVLALSLQDIVREREKALGRRVSDFSLRLDFVRWPRDYRWDVSDRHVVLGVAYLEAGQVGATRAIVAARIAQLA